jgi:predicted  nucleic acid-binding Zn-ribbon protein
MSVAGAVALAASFMSVLAYSVTITYWLAGVEAKADQALGLKVEVAASIKDIQKSQSQIKTDAAVIRERIKQMKEQGEKRDRKLDQLLREIRRRNNRN